MNRHNSPNFRWDRFEATFATSLIMHSQGKYEALVDNVLQQLADNNDKIKLITLLDLRLITLLEIANSCPDSQYETIAGQLVFPDTILARLQINENLLRSLGLSQKRSARLAAVISY